MQERTPNIVAGSFDDLVQAERACDALRPAGFADDAVQTFVVNAPGQHHALPLGGDKSADAAAKGSEKGAVAGAAIGTGVGLGVGVAAASLVGPVGLAAGAATGAWLGAMAGTLKKLGDNADQGAEAHERPAGVIVAVHAPDAGAQERALAVLGEQGARSLETAAGLWENGGWADFNPIAPPHPVAAAEPRDQIHPASGRGRAITPE